MMAAPFTDLTTVAAALRRAVARAGIVLDDTLLPPPTAAALGGAFATAGGKPVSVAGVTAVGEPVGGVLTVDAGTASVLRVAAVPITMRFWMSGGALQLSVIATMPERWTLTDSFPELTVFPFDRMSVSGARFVYSTVPQPTFGWPDEPRTVVAIASGQNLLCRFGLGGTTVTDLLSDLLGTETTLRFSGPFTPTAGQPFPVGKLTAPLGGDGFRVGTSPFALSLTEPGVAVRIDAADGEGARQEIDLIVTGVVQDMLRVSVAAPIEGDMFELSVSPVEAGGSVRKLIGQLPGGKDFDDYLPAETRELFDTVGLDAFEMVVTPSGWVDHIGLAVATTRPWTVVADVLVLTTLRLTIETIPGLGNWTTVRLVACASFLPTIFPGEFAVVVELQKQTRWEIGTISGRYHGTVVLGDIVAKLAGAATPLPSALHGIAFGDFGVTASRRAPGEPFDYECTGTALVALPVLDTELLASLTVVLDRTADGWSVQLRGILSVAEQEFTLELDLGAGGSMLTATWKKTDDPLTFSEIARELGWTDMPALPDDLDPELAHVGFGYDITAGRLVLTARTANGGEVVFATAKGDPKRTFLLNVTVPLNVRLSDVPMVGPQIPSGVDVAIVRLHAAYVSVEHTADMLDDTNEALRTTLASLDTTALPHTSLTAGLVLVADLRLGPDVRSLSLPVGTRSSPTAAPPAAIPAGHAAGGAGGKEAELAEPRVALLSLGSIGVGLTGLEDGLTDGTELTVTVTGGIRLAVLELELVGAKAVIPLSRPQDVGWGLDGLGVSATIGPLTISGAFLRSEGEFMGHITVEAPRLSFGAMGAIGTISDDDGPDTLTCFLFGSLGVAGEGAGIPLGPIVLTGIALGGGFNRRVVVPPPEEITDFPFVKMVMGEGGLQDDEPGSDLADRQGSPEKDPRTVLEAMQKSVPRERGQHFLCAGVRFTVAEVADCFGLLIAQFGNTLEFALVGLARMRQPRDLSARPLCYVEMQVLATVNPREGHIALSAVLSRHSWVIDPACRLTGGFAAHAWLGDQHSGDFVLTVGGYHPRFARPAHYPVVPRLALAWQVSDTLSITGSAYLAVTSSCVMVGGRLEIAMITSLVRVWATAALDAIISWSPLFFEVDVFIGVRFEVDLKLWTVSGALSAKVAMWGGPFGGRAELELAGMTVPVSFGADRDQAGATELTSWSAFVDSFLPSAKTPDTTAPAVLRPNLAAGRATPPTPADAGPDAAGPPEDRWLVRCDQLVLAATTVVPATEMRVGTVATNSPPQGVQDLAGAGTPQVVTDPVVLTVRARVRSSEQRLAVRPMGEPLTSVLTVTVVRDVGGAAVPVDLADWTLDEERAAMPSALWEPGTTDLGNPSASQVSGCVTGIRRLVPPREGWAGDRIPVDLGGHRTLDTRNLTPAAGIQPAPGAAGTAVVGRVLDASREARERTVDLLAGAGFALGVDRTVSRFRAVRAEPMIEAAR